MMAEWVEKIRYQLVMLRFRPRLLKLKYCKAPCDEFHKSLEYDSDMIEAMNAEDAEEYQKLIVKKRQEAHNRGCDDDIHWGL